MRKSGNTRIKLIIGIVAAAILLTGAFLMSLQIQMCIRDREKALQMDLPYVIMLTFAAVCTLYLCVSYLQLQSFITTRMRNIETLEAQLETLKAKNDDLETSINTYIDLELSLIHI